MSTRSRAGMTLTAAGRELAGRTPGVLAVAWPRANDANPVVQDFVRCCLDNKPQDPALRG